MTQVTFNPAARTARTMLKNVGIAGKLARACCCCRCSASRTSRARRSSTRRTPRPAPAGCSTTRGSRCEVSGFVHESQKERGLTALFVGSKGAKSASELKDQRALTDGRLAELRAAAKARAAPASSPPRWSRWRSWTSTAARSTRSRCPAPRRPATTRRSTPRCSTSSARSPDSSREPALTRAVEAYASYLRAKEQTGLERAALAKGFTAGSFQDGADIARFLSAVAGQDVYLQAFARQATPADARAAESAVSGKDVEEAARMREQAIARLREADLGGADPRRGSRR